MRSIVSAAGKVALLVSLPVEVLMKSAPPIIAAMEARAMARSDDRSPTARMTLMCAGPAAARKRLTSSYSLRQEPLSACSRVITTSNSRAPAAHAVRISRSFAPMPICPAGKPVDTGVTGTPLPSSSSSARVSKRG